MAEVISEVTKIRRRVLTEVAALIFNNRLVEDIEDLPKKLTDEGLTSYRCCQYKEQAILQERIKLAIGIDITVEDSKKRLEELARDVLDQPVARSNKPYITLIEEACDHCSIDKMFVTNACRNCVAHNCVNSCPRDAIKIVDNRAFIIREKCIECGLCAKACSYGAIVEIERPCSRACAVDAVVSGDKASAAIEEGNCVECGACIVACPFGAISYRSEIVNVIKMLRDSQSETVALVAPSFIGQFGPGVDWDVLKEGLKKLGFTRVVMVAVGADEVIREESRELLENIEFNKGVTFNSCCPSFKNLINKHYPELTAGISTTESPMLKTARLLKKSGDEDIKNIFIGPCLAKKGEAVRESNGLIDGVLTYEEIAAVLVGAGINLAKLGGEKSRRDNNFENPSIDALNFCAAGGVSKAILNSMERDGLQVKTAAGIRDCDKLLKQISRGVFKIDFMEGMGCQDGCIGGPGTMTGPAKAKGLLKKMSREVEMNV
ncbi:monomeric [FeFe] hydrogenase [Halocella sp. SP3-1]|uniref:monomeric [FeFe] hydrogenase n=1 Tax=Halocella sp. SP3-1 TaxID=2382161 RepID=UPI000F75C0A8|nr:monomeric [FeFe] hydrogenase [Halocella sp. SP3-1]AZO96292.1 hydrogenase assembly protein HupF [Halocella sp. SP3-1]